jgi:hypothetical protein
MVGTITPDMVPSRPVDQMAIGAANAVNTVENAWLNRPGHEPTPEEQARIGQLKGDRKVSGELIQEIQQDDSKVAQMVGNALQSVPGSVASLAAAPVASVPVAVGLGLGTNMLLETAGALSERMDEHKQTAQEAWPGATAEGALATGLELLPLHGATKYMKGAAPLGKTLLKIGGGEAIQEGGTQLGSDLLRNAEEIQDLSIGQIAANAGEAAVTGALMTPLMGGVAHGVRKGLEFDAKRQIAQQKAVAFEETGAKRELNEIFARADLAVQGVLPEDTPVIVDEPTPQELVEAKMLLEQRAKGLDVEVPARNRVLGDILDEAGNELRSRGITEPLGTDQDQSADEGGISAGVLARRKAWYQAPDLPMSKRPIVHTQDEGVLGLTLEQVGNLPRGAVVAVAAGTQEQQEKEFPAAVYGPLVQDLKAWVDKYAPEMRVVLNLEPFAPEHQESAFGLHMYRGGVHIITPRDLPGFHHEGGDQRTSIAMVVAVSHEFGHALKMEVFYQGVRGALGDELANELSRAVRKNELTDAHLALLEQTNPEEAGVLRTWRDLRQSILDGQLTAQDFVDSWVGLRKLSGSVSRNVGYRKDLYTWAEERMKAAGKTLTGATAQELILAPLGKNASQKEKAAFLDEYLSFDEYMAEQFSRAAHQAGDLESGALGKVFTKALQKLRMLFRDLKSWRGENGERIIQPGETFAKWLAKQTLWAKGQKKRAGVFRRSAKLRAAQAEVRGRLAEVLEEEKALAEPESPPEQVPPPPEVVATQVDERERLAETLEEMLHSGVFRRARPEI